MVVLQLCFKSPVSKPPDLVHDKGEWGGVGSDALEEPGGDDIRSGVTGDVWEC